MAGERWHWHRRRVGPVWAKRLRRAHLVLAAAWAAMIPVALLTDLKTSLAFVIAISLYANMAAHLASFAGESATVAAEAAHEAAEH